MLVVDLVSPLALLDSDILEELLRDKRSPSTRRTYAKGLKPVFRTNLEIIKIDSKIVTE
ncbi:MAG: hypothetical protein ACKO5Q_01915 [Microcystaceae cyanobacterium]